MMVVTMMTGPDLLGILRIILLLLIMLNNEDNDIDDVVALNILIPKRMNFQKKFKRLLTPPLIFRKLCCNFFAENFQKKVYIKVQN